MMKIFKALMGLGLVVIGLAASAEAFSISDRDMLAQINGKPLYGLLHSKNYEIKCHAKIGGEVVPFWIDTNFTGEHGTRVALGWENGMKLDDRYIALELQLESVAIGRCANYCAKIKALSNIEGDLETRVVFDISKKFGSKKYAVTVFESMSGETTEGECEEYDGQ